MRQKSEEIFRSIENYINEYFDSTGSLPTVRDIEAGIGVSRMSVVRYLSVMEERGIIEYDDHRKPLTRQMIQDRDNSTRTPLRGVPVIGSIRCGSADDSEEYFEESVKLPKSIFGDSPMYILHASGDSMIEAGIDDGDLVVVKQQSVARPGEIVVALTPDGTTLKRYFPEPQKRRIRLQPENSSMDPMYYEDVTIQGVAIKVIKDLK